MPLNAEAARALSAAALTQKLTIRHVVLCALRNIGVAVADEYFGSHRSFDQSLPGRKRTSIKGYTLSVLLPDHTFQSVKMLARKNHWAINQLVCIALQRAGLPIKDTETRGDKRRKSLRTFRRHYAASAAHDPTGVSAPPQSKER